MIAAAYKELERKLVRWSRNRPDIVATVVIGSYARVTLPADEFSDLDLILFSLDPSSYTASSSWLHELGELWIASLDYIGPGDPEWLALFDGGMKADFLIVLAVPDKSPAEMLTALPYQDVLARGARVIYSGDFDHQDLSSFSAQAIKTHPPSEPMFEAAVNGTLFAAERYAKFVLRGDFWRSQVTADAEMRRHLLTLIEWHAQSLSETKLDTWYDGRYIETWADGRILDRLSTLDLDPNPDDPYGTVSHILKLLELLATETAARLGYCFPTAGQAKTIAWLDQMSRDSQN
ncbi:MAG: aminoglycoside 6-adenylyltransferase [Chloroflexota bacterium]|nr:MAG: aminoglycoside 6-adenylyltransferase [Chloroflexota bacterium]